MNAGKRFLILFILVSMIITALPVFSMEKEEISVILNNVFDDELTGIVPPGVMGAEGTEVVNAGGKNKYLKLVADENGSSAVFSCELFPENFVVQLDVMIDDSMDSVEFAIKNTSNAAIKLYQQNHNGAKLYNSKKSSGIRHNKWTTFAFIIDTASSSYITYQNGFKISDAWVGSAFGTPQNFNVSVSSESGKTTNMLIDNVRIYSGKKLINNFSSVPYNEGVYQKDIESKPEQPIDSVTIWQKENFENHYSQNSVSISARTLKTEANILDIREENGNKYFYFERTSSDPHINFYIGPNTGKFIIQMDIDSDDMAGPQKSIGMSNYGVRILPGGNITLNDGSVIGRLNNEGFTNLAIAIDPQKYQYQIYINRKPVTKKIRGDEINFPSSLLRFYVYNTNGKASFKIDNLLTYSGDELIDINKYGGFSKEILVDTQYALNQVGDGIAVHAHAKRAIINKERIDISAKPQFVENDLWIPVEVFEKAGKKLNISTKVIDEIKYVRISDAASALNLNYFVDNKGYGFDKGFAIIGSGDYSEFSDNFMLYNEANNYLCYLRPSAETILLKQQAASNGVHPRIMATADDFELLKRELLYDKTKQKWFEQIIKSADASVGNGRPTHSLDVVRLNSLHGMVDDIINLCFAYKVTGDPKYAEEAYADLAHMGTRADWNPGHFLDIGAGANCYAVAYDWLYDYWTPERRKNLEQIIYDKALSYYHNSLHNGQYTRWIEETVAEGLQGNWPLVCSSGPIMSALALMEVYPEMCSNLVSDALRVLEYTLKGFSDNGDWTEGALYWAYTNGFLARMISSMELSLGTEFDYYYGIPGIMDTVDYAYSLITPQNVYNFGDAEDVAMNLTSASWHASMVAKKDEAKALDMYKLVMKYYNAKGFSGGLWDIFKMDNRAATGDPENLSMEYCSPKTGYANVRSGWNFADEAFLGYLFGSTQRTSHNHYDHGSFIYEAFGKRWAIDLGRDDYNMSDYDNVAYRVRTEGHNTYVVNPDEKHGQNKDNYQTYIVDKKINSSSYYSIVDITSSYEGKLNQARRGYKLTDNMKSLIVRDEISFKESSDFWWFMHTPAEVTVEGNTAYLKNGMTMKVEVISNQPLEFGVMDAVPLETSPIVKGAIKNNPNKGIKKLYLKGKVSGNLNVTMKMSPYIDGVEVSPISDLPFTNWTLDAEIPKKEAPKITSININGESFAAFNSDITSYTFMKMGNQVPQISAYSSNGDIKVNCDEKSANIIVFDKNDKSNYKVYNIEFITLNSPNVGNKYRLVNPASLTASAEPQSENPIKAAMDGNLVTRWAGNGEQWIMQTFDKEIELAAVELSWMNGAKRNQFFKIQYSTDGENFIDLFDGKSSGLTEDLEIYEFTPVKAKYVRILCDGTTEGTWTSMTEFYVHEKNN